MYMRFNREINIMVEYIIKIKFGNVIIVINLYENSNDV